MPSLQAATPTGAASRHTRSTLRGVRSDMPSSRPLAGSPPAVPRVGRAPLSMLRPFDHGLHSNGHRPRWCPLVRRTRGRSAKGPTPSDLHVCQIRDAAQCRPLHVEAEHQGQGYHLRKRCIWRVQPALIQQRERGRWICPAGPAIHPCRSTGRRGCRGGGPSASRPGSGPMPRGRVITCSQRSGQKRELEPTTGWLRSARKACHVRRRRMACELRWFDSPCG